MYEVREPIPVKMAAALLGCGLTTVYKHFKLGNLEGYHVGVEDDGIRIYKDSVDRFRESRSNRRRPAEGSQQPKPRPAGPRRKVPPLPPPKIGGYGHGL